MLSVVQLRNFLIVSTSALVEPVISEASTSTIPCHASAVAFWSSWKESPSENHSDRCGSGGNSHAQAVDVPIPWGPTRNHHLVVLLHRVVRACHHAH